ncbi:hypothetical protein BSKO_11620 [Bryopsis sp. KO-2023]|nr:hypothetical protein BSKO_11620 [Bryopsis sp. KO-2023]
MPDEKVLCKYYASGCCKYGNECRFTHDFGATQSMVCKFYLQGGCSYGDKCRYDHVKPDWKRNHAPPATASNKKFAPAPPPPLTNLSRPAQGQEAPANIDNYVDHIKPQDSSSLPKNPWGNNPWGSAGVSETAGLREHQQDEKVEDAFDYFLIDDNPDDEFDLWRRPDQTDQEQAASSGEEIMCWTFCNSGFCPDGEDCSFAHGDFCKTCEKYCLDKKNLGYRVQHIHQCREMHARLVDYTRSAELECAICLEKVFSKPSLSDRRFGLMACDHVFCLSCIRNWRSNTDGTVDIASALRTCPICRVATHFVTPSAIFPDNESKKAAIVEGYVQKMGEIDCRAFNFGEGQCPFANSCFYRHVYRDGSKAEIILRTAANSDGEVKVVRGRIQLGDLLETAQARRVMNRRRRR